MTVTILICVVLFLVIIVDYIVKIKQNNVLCEHLYDISTEMYLFRKAFKNYCDKMTDEKLKIKSYAAPLKKCHTKTLLCNEYTSSADENLESKLG